MLFNYVPNPDQSNWLQEFLTSLVKEALDAHVGGRAPRSWQTMLAHPYAPILESRRGLKSRYTHLTKTVKKMSSEQSSQLLALLNSPSYYREVLAGQVSYKPASGISDEFLEAMKSVYDFGFDLLGKLESAPGETETIRDRMYRLAYTAMPAHYCPFCGIDRFDAPHSDMPRHALDHYLAISEYPAFGTHLPNLVPMCGRCNSSFKLAADMLKADDGTSRACVDPYGDQIATISLMNSSPFGGGVDGQVPLWRIDFEPPSEAFETWDNVFKVRLRYSESFLDAEYHAWLDDFAKWGREKQLSISNNQDASNALNKWASLCPELRDQGFLKRPMFEMLAAYALLPDANGARVTRLVRTLCAL